MMTSDLWILEIIHRGYSLEFTERPPTFKSIKETPIPRKKSARDCLTEEVQCLLKKGVVEIVPPNEVLDGYYSTFFLTPKSTGGLRPILNVRPLNQFLVKKHFKMETLNTVLKATQPGDWGVVIDLRDAYHHIAIAPEHQKFLRFFFMDTAFQFRALPFGPRTAPRVFTKVTAAVAEHLHKLGYRIHMYLDDWILLHQSRVALIQQVATLVQFITGLGFLINWEKSQLQPQQDLVYLGAFLQLRQGIVSPTESRFQKITELSSLVMKKKFSTAEEILQLLGLMVSMIGLVPHARLFLRPLQIYLLAHWKPSSRDLQAPIPVQPPLLPHLRWWTVPQNILIGQTLAFVPHSITVETDASKTGWGAACQKLRAQGTWSCHLQKEHINILEMLAVEQALFHFKTLIQGKQILVKSDNSTVVTYLNKEGGTRSPHLCMLTWRILQWCLQNKVAVRATHIAGIRNTIADHLSRRQVIPTEWTLNRGVVQHIFNLTGTPNIDLFASDLNHQLPVFCSWTPSSQALAIDAFSVQWDNWFGYAFPPTCLIPRVLLQMRITQQYCKIILIAPRWPRRSWYPQILELTVAKPIILPLRQDLLRQPKGQYFHPDPERLQLTAFVLSNSRKEHLYFLSQLNGWSEPPCEKDLGGTTTLSTESSQIGAIAGTLIPAILL